jgi:hypothetical protein
VTVSTVGLHQNTPAEFSGATYFSSTCLHKSYRAQPTLSRLATSVQSLIARSRGITPTADSPFFLSYKNFRRGPAFVAILEIVPLTLERNFIEVNSVEQNSEIPPPTFTAQWK